MYDERMVKCCITKERGRACDFIKIDRKFYKSQEIYEKFGLPRNQRNILHNIFIEEFLGNVTTYGGYLAKKLKDTKIPYDTLLFLMDENKEYLKKKTAGFESHIGITNYVFKVLESKYETLICNEVNNLDTEEN